jgi:glycosyltransferase involved in cell wall biosynthesis
MRTPVSVLVLTHDEEVNIAACVQSVSWAAEVIVVDSFSADKTVEIAGCLGAHVYSHRFEGYAKQRNWALSNVPISQEWILILDADERATEELAREITQRLSDPRLEKAGFYLSFRHRFMGRWLKHGGLYPTWVLRLFRREAGRFEQRPMNEHLILNGAAGYLKEPFEHRDRRPLSAWITKHIGYADLQAQEYLGDQSGDFPESLSPRLFGTQAARKRWLKIYVWNRLPLLLRPFLFFFRNYFLRAGFLDGRPGFIYHVLWSFWFPFLTDVKIIERLRVNTVGDSAALRRANQIPELAREGSRSV